MGRASRDRLQPLNRYLVVRSAPYHTDEAARSERHAHKAAGLELCHSFGNQIVKGGGQRQWQQDADMAGGDRHFVRQGRRATDDWRIGGTGVILGHPLNSLPT